MRLPCSAPRLLFDVHEMLHTHSSLVHRGGDRMVNQHCDMGRSGCRRSAGGNTAAEQGGTAARISRPRGPRRAQRAGGASTDTNTAASGGAGAAADSTAGGFSASDACATATATAAAAGDKPNAADVVPADGRG